MVKIDKDSLLLKKRSKARKCYDARRMVKKRGDGRCSRKREASDEQKRLSFLDLMAILIGRLVQFLFLPWWPLLFRIWVAQISVFVFQLARADVKIRSNLVLADGSFRTVDKTSFRRVVNAVLVDFSAFLVDVGGVASLLYEDKRT